MPKKNLFLSKGYFKSVYLNPFKQVLEEVFGKEKVEQSRENIIIEPNNKEHNALLNRNILFGGDTKKIEKLKVVLEKYSAMRNYENIAKNNVNLMFKENEDKNNFAYNLLDQENEETYQTIMREVESDIRSLVDPEIVNLVIANPKKNPGELLDKLIKNDMADLNRAKQEQARQQEVLERNRLAQEENERVQRQQALDTETAYKRSLFVYFHEYGHFLPNAEHMILENVEHQNLDFTGEQIAQLNKKIYEGLQIDVPLNDDRLLQKYVNEPKALKEELRNLKPDQYIAAQRAEYNRIFAPTKALNDIDFFKKVESLELYSQVKRTHAARLRPKWYHFFYRPKYNRETAFLQELENNLLTRGITQAELEASLTKDARFITATGEINKANNPEYYLLENLANDRLLINVDELSVNPNKEQEVKLTNQDLKAMRQSEIKDKIIEYINEVHNVNFNRLKMVDTLYLKKEDAKKYLDGELKFEDVYEGNDERKKLYNDAYIENEKANNDAKPLIEEKAREEFEKYIKPIREENALKREIKEAVEAAKENNQEDVYVRGKLLTEDQKDEEYYNDIEFEEGFEEFFADHQRDQDTFGIEIKENTIQNEYQIVSVDLPRNANNQKIQKNNNMNDIELAAIDIYNSLNFKGANIKNLDIEIDNLCKEAVKDYEVYSDVDMMDLYQNEKEDNTLLEKIQGKHEIIKEAKDNGEKEVEVDLANIDNEFNEEYVASEQETQKYFEEVNNNKKQTNKLELADEANTLDDNEIFINTIDKDNKVIYKWGEDDNDKYYEFDDDGKAFEVDKKTWEEHLEQATLERDGNVLAK